MFSTIVTIVTMFSCSGSAPSSAEAAGRCEWAAKPDEKHGERGQDAWGFSKHDGGCWRRAEKVVS